MKKRVIIDLPKGQSGLQVKMRDLRAGLGLNANTMPWPIMAGKMSEPNVQVNSTLSPVPRDEANLEAEKGEVAALPTKSGIPDTYKIGGKRHYEGGTPLNLPKDSFIYSDTPKMRIKDKVVLAQFGMPERKSGYTPAEIAKKYDVAPFKKILVDKNTDKLQKETAELMIANYNLKLAKLALVQESMKGFPQGIPLVAMPYIESMQIDPAEFVQMNPGQGDAGAQQEEAGSTMAYGGDVDYFDDGGVPKLNRRKRNAVDNAVQSSYNKMLEGRATDQYDELFYDAGLSNDKVRKFMVNAAGPSGATNDPGTYARNINNLLGRAVIPFPVNQNRMTEENWNAIGIGSGPRIPDMYYNDDAPAGPYRNMNYETLTPIKPSISEFDPAYEFMAYGGNIDYFDNGGYTSEAEYKAHLLDPYSPEKAKAQLDWNMNKMYYTQPKNNEEKRKRLDYLQNNMSNVGFNPLEFYKRQQEAGQLFQELGKSNPELVKKEIKTGQNAGKLMMAAGKYIFPGAAPAFNAIEGSMAVGEFAQNPNMHNTASLATEVAPFINNKYGTAYQLMGDYLTGQEVGLLPADKKAYGGMPRYADGGGKKTVDPYNFQKADNYMVSKNVPDDPSPSDWDKYNKNLQNYVNTVNNQIKEIEALKTSDPKLYYGLLPTLQKLYTVRQDAAKNNEKYTYATTLKAKGLENVNTQDYKAPSVKPVAAKTAAVKPGNLTLAQQVANAKVKPEVTMTEDEENYYAAHRDAEEQQAQSAAYNALADQYAKVQERLKAGDVASSWVDALPFTNNSAEKETEKFYKMATAYGYNPANLERVLSGQSKFKDYDSLKGYKSEAEYRAHLLDPDSPEKRANNQAWLLSHPDQIRIQATAPATANRSAEEAEAEKKLNGNKPIAGQTEAEPDYSKMSNEELEALLKQ